MLREFEESGLLMAAFCRQWGLSYSTLVAWRRAARVDRFESTGPDHDSAPRFVEIEAVLPEAERWRQPGGGHGSRKALPTIGALVAELSLPGGAVLRIFQGADLGKAGVEGGVS